MKKTTLAINALTIAFTAAWLEQVGHESAHGVLATLVGATWTQLNLFFAEHAWTGQPSPLGEGILTGGAAIFNILLALISMALFKRTKSTVRLFWFYMAVFNLFGGFGYLFTDPLFYQRGGENLGDWKKIVDILGGGWNARLPIALIGAAGVLWGFMWVGKNAHAFLPTEKPERLRTALILLLLPYIVVSLTFTLLAFAAPYPELGPIIAIKYWFGFFGLGWGAFMSGMWIQPSPSLERSELPEFIQPRWFAAAILLLVIAVFVLLPTLNIG